MDALETAARWILKKVRKGQVWCALLSLSLGLAVASALDGPSPGPPPLLEDRSLDATVAEKPLAESDGAPGVGFYLVVGGSTLVFFILLSLFNGRVGRGLLGEAMERERSGILLLSQFALALYVLHQVGGEVVPESLRGLLHFFCGLLIASMAAKHLVAVSMQSGRKWALVWSLLNDDRLMLAALFMPPAAIAFAGLPRGTIDPFAELSMPARAGVYLVALLAVLALYALAAGRVVARKRGAGVTALHELNSAAIVAAAPLTLIPLGNLMANELQFAMPIVDPRVFGLALALALASGSLGLFVLHRRGRVRVGVDAVLAGFYFPSLVATLASFRTHVWDLDLGRLDYFHAGQKALPVQQWWEIGSVPLLDLLPGQGLSDVGVPMLFALLNGIEDFDLLIWLPWIPVVVGFLVIYAFLAVVTAPFLALLVTVLLPVQAVIVGQYAVALLPPLLLVWTLRRSSFRRFLLLWLIAASLTVWRPQLGWPAVLALMIVVAVAVLSDRRRMMVPALASLALVLASIPAGLLMGEILWQGNTYDAAVDFLNLMRGAVPGQFGGLQVESGMRAVTSLLQRLLPVVAVLCVLYFGLRQFVRQLELTPRGYAVGYLVVFSLLLPARAGVDHGGAFFDPSFLLLILVLLPFLVLQRGFTAREIKRSAWLLVGLVSCSLLGTVEIPHLVGGGVDHAKMRPWTAEDRRVTFYSRPHEALLELLRQELEEDQSFVDFTGSAALYALSSRRYPLRSITDFRGTSESLQRSQVAAFEDQRLAGQLPLLLFRPPRQLVGAAVEPPTEALSYRVAEYLYANYRPWAAVAGWEIWKERGVDRGRPTAPAKMISPQSVRQSFRLGYLPYRWAREDPWGAIDKTDVLASVSDSPLILRPHRPTPLAWAPPDDFPLATYLHVRARPLWSRKPELVVSYGREPRNSFVFHLVGREPGAKSETTRIELQLKEDPKSRRVLRLRTRPDRFVFRSTGQDPWLQRFVDLEGAPPLEAGTEQWIEIRYRADTNGEAQIFFTTRGESFLEADSLRFPVTATRGRASRAVEIPVLGVPVGGRLANLRLDPPSESELELLEVNLIRRPLESEDYLIRLTSQFQWATEGSQRLSLSSESQVLVDAVYLRAGD